MVYIYMYVMYKGCRGLGNPKPFLEEGTWELVHLGPTWGPSLGDAVSSTVWTVGQSFGGILCGSVRGLRNIPMKVKAITSAELPENPRCMSDG